MTKKAEIVNSAIDGIPEINLRGMIDDYEDGSIVMAIDSCGASKLRMNINSMGGSVNLGQEVIAAMQAFKNAGGIIETVNRGIAYSTAGWIFSAGSKGHRQIMPFATLMTHPPMFADGKTLSDFPQGSDKWNILTDAMQKLIDIFAPVTGRTKNAIKKFMMESTTFSAKQAVKEGFADVVVEISNSVVLKNDLQPEEIINATESINYEIVNNKPGPGNNQKTNMKEVARLLNLNPDASEESILKAIQDIKNRAEVLEGEVKNSATKLEQAQTEAESLRNEISGLKDSEVVNYVKKYIGDDKARQDIEESLLNMAKADFETFKNICPLDVVNAGAKIDEGIKPDAGGGKKDESLEDAKKFFNMSLGDREKLKKENMSEYNKLVNAYDKNQAKII